MDVKHYKTRRQSGSESHRARPKKMGSERSKPSEIIVYTLTQAFSLKPVHDFWSQSHYFRGKTT